jgi:hypothetical protein
VKQVSGRFRSYVAIQFDSLGGCVDIRVIEKSLVHDRVIFGSSLESAIVEEAFGHRVTHLSSCSRRYRELGIEQRE